MSIYFNDRKNRSKKSKPEVNPIEHAQRHLSLAPFDEKSLNQYKLEENVEKVQ